MGHDNRTPPSPRLSLDPDVVVEDGDADGWTTVRHSRGALRLAAPLARRLEPLLRAGPVLPPLQTLEDRLLDREDPFAVAELYYALLQLDRFGLLRHHLIVDGRPLLTVVHASSSQLFEVAGVARDTPLRISRFAAVTREGTRLVIDCTDKRCRVELNRPEALAILAVFTSATARRDVSPHRASGFRADEIDAVVCYLAAAGVLISGAERSEVELWEPHDLAFHRRSRRGGFSDPVGATYRMLGRQEPEPAVPTHREGPRTRLAVPAASTIGDDPSLFTAMELRRSIRRYDSEPVSLEQLGHLLFRVARVRGSLPADPAAGRPYALTDRPYPSGGGAHELEIYATVGRCAGLERGCYYYDPVAHELVRLGTTSEQVNALLDDARMTTGGEADPQVLFTFTSRMRRLAWKYSGIAYATTLKNVGVLYQSFYLVATAMGLAPCGLGSGDSDLVTTSFVLSDLVEVPVGEFILGSRAEPGTS